jgi:uncharacterized protein YbcC (UPF0753/DUF2309 family)
LSDTTPRDDRTAPGAESEPRFLYLLSTIEHASHLLPAQGPITVFIHHNTLHAFEDLPFDKAVRKGARLFGCHPYLSKQRYREELARGRIRFDDLRAVLQEDLGARADEKVLRLCTRLELRLAMLQYPLRFGPTSELLWFVAETDALRKVRPDVSAAARGRLIAETRRWAMRDLRGHAEARGKGAAARRANGLAGLFDRFGASRVEAWGEDTWETFTLHALWRVCCDGAAALAELTPPPPPPVRHRDLLLRATGVDADLPVHALLVRFCGAFLDQGLAAWQMPRRDEGFFRAFAALYGRRGGPPDRWLRGLADELDRLQQGRVTPLQAVAQSLDALGVGEEEWDDFLGATLVALSGWGGILQFLEERPDRAVRPVPRGSLVEFLAVRLLLDRLALAHVARDTLGFTGSLANLRPELRRRAGPARQPSAEQRAFLVFQLAQVLGWTPPELHRLGEMDWRRLVEEVESFSALQRQRVFHLGYERRLHTQALDAIALHNRAPRREPATPRFQAMFCIDERAESLRRHVEELAPDAVTFGIAGFYFVDMYYRGASDAHFVPLCPAVMQPGHWVVEEVVGERAESHRRRARRRRALGLASHQVRQGSRTFALGALVSAAVGVLATAPLVARTLFPRLTGRLRKALGRFVQAPPQTRLHLERRGPTPGPEGDGVGYTLEEMTAIAERVLRDTGLISGFARLVLILGHGSTSMNNPHESAHDCGACGGSQGGPNGRAVAQVLNDPRVRERLAARGLVIPPQTVFVGGMHNTSSEALTFYDLDQLPATHREELEAVRELSERAADRDAHERCRRFQSAPLTLSFAAARQHVEGRAEDLAQVRPEWGHATNALCVVGRRSRTRGLFLDRRAFLNSYDPTQDDDAGTILERVLRAAVPVCAGISLEYYFSYVDNVRFGSGTKLPHNVASLVGVMDGAASDLRTGLPWQMVEIHEPVRILFVVETRPAVLLRILGANPYMGRLARNGWAAFATLDPDSPAIQVYRDGAFHDYQPQAEELPRAASSLDWYRGWRDHLEFARIGLPRDEGGRMKDEPEG